MNCPKCKKKAIKNGSYKAENKHIQRYICKRCGVSFREISNPLFIGLHRPANQIIKILKNVVFLFYNGSSFRESCNATKIKRDTVIRWLKRFGKHWDSWGNWFFENSSLDENEFEILCKLINKHSS